MVKALVIRPERIFPMMKDIPIRDCDPSLFARTPFYSKNSDKH